MTIRSQQNLAFGSIHISQHTHMTYRSQIRAEAIKLLLAHPAGLRFGELRARIWKALPQIPRSTISTNVAGLDALFPDEIVKPARGLFVHAKHKKGVVPSQVP